MTLQQAQDDATGGFTAYDKTRTRITEPAILTASCWFWSPGQSANQRRGSEERHHAAVQEYLDSLMLDVVDDSCTDSTTATDETGQLVAKFHYRETCGHVYKHLSIQVHGKKSNISALRTRQAVIETAGGHAEEVLQAIACKERISGKPQTRGQMLKIACAAAGLTAPAPLDPASPNPATVHAFA